LQAANLGLSIHPNTAEAYLIPYKASIQMQLSYKGMIKLISRSAKISHVEAYAVHNEDYFEYEYGLNPKLIHKPNMQLITSQTFKAVYAICTFSNGNKRFIVLGKDKIEQLRLKNMMQKGDLKGAWLTDYPEMAKAKAIKQLAKELPLEIEVKSAMQFDEARFTKYSQVYTENNIISANVEYEEADAKVIDTETGEIDLDKLPSASDIGIEV
jgi:recombination protein RecT